MVFFFTLSSDPSFICYMGRDKYENEKLIRWGWPEDVWFHVDALSSAHVYLRSLDGRSIDSLTEAVIEEAAQLCKANSIQGNKLNNIKVVYTPWENLKKTNGMDVGQVGFHDDRKVRSVVIAKRKNEIINRLEKTRIEKDPDLEAERNERDAEERRKQKQVMLQQQEKERVEMEERKRAAELRSYTTLQDSDKMTSNAQASAALEEDFM
eukprot:TRINITY_DN93974_c0_g1_i1.p1 TRINITY_DN93974_c0_g1~~TRINITY_DN93974_c0_g1_i1.p1  ORF type:complete len:216 (-),score=51.08 TRINITY_DN93974_c0_g1_i1:83-709(-)